MDEQQCAGYFQFFGARVDEDYFSARSASDALQGIDGVMRRMISVLDGEIASEGIDIPVKIKQGSWIASIPEMLIVGGGIVATAYLTSAATTVAKNDFAEKKTADICRKAIEGIQWIVRIAKHLGGMGIMGIRNFTTHDDSYTLGIPNEAGEYLRVPKNFWDLYTRTPKSFLKKLVSVVDDHVELKIVSVRDGKETSVEVGYHARRIFGLDDEVVTDVILPELTHGMPIEFDGYVTKGNDRTNNIGFLYQNHVITCSPRAGNITSFKDRLFTVCRIKGVIDRRDEFGGLSRKRPKIVFETLNTIGPLQDTLDFTEVDDADE